MYDMIKINGSNMIKKMDLNKNNIHSLRKSVKFLNQFNAQILKTCSMKERPKWYI